MLLTLLWLLRLLPLREGVAQHLPVSTAHSIAQVQDNVRHRQRQPPAAPATRGTVGGPPLVL